MTLFSFAFAAFLFTSLPAEQAGELLRKAFPYFYLFVIVVSAVAALLFWPLDRLGSALLIAVALTTIPARQLLMPAINAATDANNASRFKVLHGASVVLTLLHIAAIGYVLLRTL